MVWLKSLFSGEGSGQSELSKIPDPRRIPTSSFESRLEFKKGFKYSKVVLSVQIDSFLCSIKIFAINGKVHL